MPVSRLSRKAASRWRTRGGFTPPSPGHGRLASKGTPTSDDAGAHSLLGRLVLLLQTGQNSGVGKGGEVTECFAFGNIAQQTPHDFAAAGFR